MDLEILAEDNREFLADHGRWCADFGGMSLTVSRNSSLDTATFNPYATTNLSNAPATPAQNVRYYDAAGDFAAFIEAFPRWAPYSVP